MAALPLEQEDKGVAVGTICLARVADVVKGVKGAFLNLQEQTKAYLPFDKHAKMICISRKLDTLDELHKDDQVVVQIVSEPLKTKVCSVTTDLTLTGQFCVAHLFGHGINYSKKLTEEKKNWLKETISSVSVPGRKQFGFTIRTNAEMLTDTEPLIREMTEFTDRLKQIQDTASHRTLYSVFYQREHPLLSLMKDIPLSDYDEIVTDDLGLYEMIRPHFKMKQTRYYQDNLLSLAKLYSIESHLKEALSKTVWLSCGGYLVIEPTEAMVVIDVNSGKANAGSRKKNIKLQVNLEAAVEIARQLRLRNYSGMIMVDFINLDSKTEEELLLNTLAEELLKDKVHTRLVDLTALGVVEITRKKQRKPLADYFQKAIDN